MSKVAITEIRNTTRLDPVGECIYCGFRSKLSDEHIIPLALGGRVILPKASCSLCSRITSAFESKVLANRGFMHNARTVGHFPTRHPRNRPKTVWLQTKVGPSLKSVELPIADASALLHLPMLPQATFLEGRQPVKGVRINGIETIYFGKTPQEVASNLGTKELQDTTNWDITSFVRMIAKIGYGLAVGTQGVFSRNESPVLPLILGLTDDGSTWVGSADYSLEIEGKKPLHAFSLVSLNGSVNGEAVTVLVTRVKLFASAGATGYEVVVRRKVRA